MAFQCALGNFQEPLVSLPGEPGSQPPSSLAPTLRLLSCPPHLFHLLLRFSFAPHLLTPCLSSFSRLSPFHSLHGSCGTSQFADLVASGLPSFCRGRE